MFSSLIFYTSFNMSFLKRNKKKRCVYGSGDGKELEKCRECFFALQSAY